MNVRIDIPDGWTPEQARSAIRLLDRLIERNRYALDDHPVGERILALLDETIAAIAYRYADAICGPIDNGSHEKSNNGGVDDASGDDSSLIPF